MRPGRSLWRRAVHGACACFMALIGFAVPDGVQAVQSQGPVGPAAHECSALVDRNFLEIPDATTHIVSATIVAATTDIAEFCKVVGTIAPDVGFELDMPTATWNGRLLMQGCGGTCGVVSTAGCQDVLAKDFAIVQTDMGHRGKPISGSSWAQNNRQAVIDFGFRATHVTIVAAKVIQAEFYHRPADHTYFRGCSTGGRQAMVEAQRFPEDFDGIIAVAPPLDESGDAALHLGWSARAATDRTGHRIIDADDVRRVHEAVLAACHPDSRIKDAVIQDPSTCQWRVSEMLCSGRATRASDGGPCLTAAKVDAFQKIYDGARNSAGKKLFHGGMPLGSELGWIPYFVSADGGQAKVLSADWLISEQMRYLAFYDTQPAGYTIYDFDYDRDVGRLGLTEAFFDAQNPDLRPFKAHQGKLILIQGWSDSLIAAPEVIDYYETVLRTIGGRKNTEDFFRLFMVPGMGHCIGGDTADAIDSLTAIEQWVEQGIAPDRVVSYHVTHPQTLLHATRFPLQAGDADWSRPLFPFPDTAVWSGRGDWMDANTWQREVRKWPGAIEQ